MATRSYSAGSVYLNFFLKPATFCKLSSDLCSTNKSVTSLPFSSSHIFALFLPHFFCFRPFSYLTSAGRKYPFSIRLQLIPITRLLFRSTFFQETTRLGAGQIRCAAPAICNTWQSLSCYLFPFLFSRTGGVLLPHHSFSAHKFP